MNTLLALLFRAALIYGFYIVIMRLAGRRTVKEGTTFDFVVALILSDLPDGAILGQTSVIQSAVAIVTLLACHIAFSTAAYRSDLFDRLVTPNPRILISEGQLVRDHLARERLNEQDLLALLRLQHVDDLAEVQQAHLELSGRLSVQKHPFVQAAEKRDLDKRDSINWK